MLLAHLRGVECRCLVVSNRIELGLAGLELHPRPLELCLLGGDLVASVADLADEVFGLVAKTADAVNDACVLVLDPVEVVVAADEVVEAVGVEDDRERIGLVGLVDLDEPLGEDVQGAAEALAKGCRGDPSPSRAGPRSRPAPRRRWPRGCEAPRLPRRADRSASSSWRSQSRAPPPSHARSRAPPASPSAATRGPGRARARPPG